MDSYQLIALISTVTIAVIGWLVGHMLSSRREIMQKRREIRIQYLREAYLKLAHIADNPGNLENDIFLIQQSLNDIQLFGAPEQINLIKKLITDINHEGKASMDQLLIQVRNEIRYHLRLPSIDGERWHLRLISKKQSEPKN